jgi:two-component system sensor histidine kinase MprB
VSFRTRIGVLVAATAAVTVAAASLIVYVQVRSQMLAQVDETLGERVNQVGTFKVMQGGGAVAPAPGTAGAQSGEGISVTGPGSAPQSLFRCTVPVSPPAGLPTPPAGGCGMVISLGQLPATKLGAAGGYTQIVGAGGRVVLAPGEPVQLPVSGADRQLALSGGKGVVYEDATVAGTAVRIATAAVGGGQLLQVARPLDEVDTVLGRLRWILAGLCLAVVLVAGFLGRLVARRTLQPVDRLMLAAEHVADTRDLRRRIEEPGQDELGRLAHSFNRMLEALDDSQRTQRQLVADASHELRTPLSSLRTNIEVLARGGAELGADDRDRLLEDVLGQVERLSHLVADLMDLARGDEPRSRVRAEVPLDEVVTAAVEVAGSHFPGVRFTVDARPTVVEGDPDRLARAVANLLDNAGKWSPPGGEVVVGVSGGEVTVRDHGPGIAPEHAQHVFQRFWRAPDARRKPGSGLGLAIVQQVAESHGGEVRVEQAPGGGALLRLRLPS